MCNNFFFNMATFRRHICDGHIVCGDFFNHHHDRISCHHFCVQNPLCARAKNRRTNEDVAYISYCYTQHDSYSFSGVKKAYNYLYLCKS